MDMRYSIDLLKQAKRRQGHEGIRRGRDDLRVPEKAGPIGYRTRCLAGQVGSHLSIFFQWLLIAFACTGTLIGSDRLGAGTHALLEGCPQPSTSHVPCCTHVDGIFRC